MDDFFAVFKKLRKAQRFGREFDNLSTDLAVGVNVDKKELGCLVNFHGLEFDTVKMGARLPKNKLEKAIEKLLNCWTREVPLLTRNYINSFTARVIYPG